MELPDDIKEAAANCIPVGLNGNHYLSTLRGHIEQALLAERLSVAERAAKIAENAYDSNNHADRSPRHIAAAIRSQP